MATERTLTAAVVKDALEDGVSSALPQVSGHEVVRALEPAGFE